VERRRRWRRYPIGRRHRHKYVRPGLSGSEVTVLKDGQVVTTTTADSKANFYIALTGLTPGNYFFSLYSEDAQGRRSSLVTFQYP